MFLIRYLRNSFQFSEMVYRTKESLFKVFIYFLILSLISVFPMSFLIIREQGWKLDFIEESFKEETPTWDLPRDCSIEINRFFCDSDLEYVVTHQEIVYIFNYQGGSYDRTQKHILFTHKEIIYDNGEAEMRGNYGGFETALEFNSFNLLNGDERAEAFINFGSSVELSFSRYIVFYSIMVNTMIMIATNLLFIVLLSFVLQLFRFGYSTFFTYKESLIFIVYAMGLPAILSFIIGIFAPGVSTVIYQFGVGIIVMITMLKYGKKRFA